MINHEYNRKFGAWLEQNREKILNDWMDLARIPSIRSEALPGAPFGKACAEALEKSAELCRERGFETRVNAEGGYALAEYGDGEKVIGIFAHSDVVPVGDGWIYTEPFEPVIRDGSMFGRGVSDNKSGVMIALCVLEMLRDCQIPLKNRVQIFVGSNEESGMKDIAAYVQNEKMPELSLVPDAGFACSLGEKGIFRLWAESGRKMQAIRSCTGGEAFNIVLDRAEFVLEPDGKLEAELRGKIGDDEDYRLSVAEDGAICLQTRGIAKHASDPEGSRNALLMAAELLAECETLNENDRELMRTVVELLQSPYGAGMGIACEDEHFGKLTAVNGMMAEKGGRLQVSLDIRYGSSLSADEVEEKTKNAWEARGWTVQTRGNRGGFETDPNSFVPDVMKTVHLDVTGRAADTFYMSGGTYARYLQNAFSIGTSAYVENRKTPKLELPAGRGAAHQRDERKDLEEFFMAVRVIVNAVVACDERL